MWNAYNYNNIVLIIHDPPNTALYSLVNTIEQFLGYYKSGLLTVDFLGIFSKTSEVIFSTAELLCLNFPTPSADL